jgi:FeS assembly SUF system regulator
MMRINKLTDYATVVLARMAAAPARLHTAAELAGDTRVSLPTVSKILKKLHRAGLVDSARGACGGYQLSRPPAQISAAAILDALEGPVAITECSGKGSRCGIEHVCRISPTWRRINGAIRNTLNDVSLAQLAGLDK